MKNATEGSAAELVRDAVRCRAYFGVPEERDCAPRTECKLAVSEDGRPNVYEDYYLIGTGPYERSTGSHTDPLADEPMTAPSAVF